MFRVIRKVDYTPTKEVIKEFLRFIGCMISDHPVQTCEDAKSIMANTKDAVDILLGFEYDMQDAFVQEIRCSGGGRALLVNREKPAGTTKATYYSSLINKMIDSVWTDECSPDGTGLTQRAQLKTISHIFFHYDLFGYFQSKRALRIIDMPEVYGDRSWVEGLRQKIFTSSVGTGAEYYINNMLDAFQKTYKDLCRIPKPGIYARYAKINIARKIREVHDGFIVTEGGEVPGAKALLKELDDLYDLDRTYMGTVFLAAAVCKSDPSLFLTSSNYLRLLLDTIQEQEEEFYSFAYYEYGRHLERVYRNWDLAIAYYIKAVKVHPQNYQAEFKLGYYEAQYKGNYSKAANIFQHLRDMIAKEYSGNEHMDYGNLSLKAIQYLYKTDMWLWILCKELGYAITADISLKFALLDAHHYQKNECVKMVYDEDDPRLKVLQEYHENSLPVHVMLDAVREEMKQVAVENQKENGGDIDG